MKIFSKTTGHRTHIYFCGIKIASYRTKPRTKPYIAKSAVFKIMGDVNIDPTAEIKGL